MTPEIVQALFWLVRIMIMNLCGGFLIAHGVITAEQLADFAQNSTATLFAGVAFAATVYWSWRSRRKSAVIARVAALPEITSIHAAPDIAANQPSNKVVPVPPAQP